MILGTYPERNPVNKLTSIAITSLILVTTACGSDDSASTSGNSDQAKVADLMVTEIAKEDIELDRSCVEKLAAQLSDDDAKGILDSYKADNEPNISPEGEAIGEQMIGCASGDSMADKIMESVGDQEGMDKECLREFLDGLSPEEMAAIGASDGDMSGDALSPIMAEVMSCITMGG